MAFHFDGTDDRLRITGNHFSRLNISTGISFRIAFRPFALTNADHFLFIKGQSASGEDILSNYSFSLYNDVVHSNWVPSFQYGDGTNKNIWTGNQIISDTQNYDITFAYQFQSQYSPRMYINGALVTGYWVQGAGLDSGVQPPNLNNGPLLLGGDNDGTSHFNGLVYEFSLWECPIPENYLSNITLSRQKARGPEISGNNLLFVFPCNEGSFGQSIPTRTGIARDVYYKKFFSSGFTNSTNQSPVATGDIFLSYL